MLNPDPKALSRGINLRVDWSSISKRNAQSNLHTKAVSSSTNGVRTDRRFPVFSEILADSIVLSTPEGEIVLKNDFVFALTGYSPDLNFLNSIGITLEPATQKPRTDPLTLESERSGIYLAGVIVAGMHTNEIFIENGRFHGKQIADAIAARLSG